MVLPPPFGRRPASGGAAVLLSAWLRSERPQPWVSPGRPGGPAPHDGSRPGWGGGLKVPACLCSLRPDRPGGARPVLGSPLRWGVRLMRAGGRGWAGPGRRSGPSRAFFSPFGPAAALGGGREQPAGPENGPAGL